MKSLAKILMAGFVLSLMGAQPTPCLAGGSATFSSAPGQLIASYSYSNPGVSVASTAVVGGNTSVSVNQNSRVNISGIVQVSSGHSSATVTQHGQYNYSQVIQFGNIYAGNVAIQY
jgi:hypothetical protein